jgi:hypothetical protein
MANTITKYENIINTLKNQVRREVDSILLNNFNPIIEEINKDISTFILLEKLDNLIQDMPKFKKLQSNYNNLLDEYNHLKNMNINISDNHDCQDISLIINDITKCGVSNNENIKVDTNYYSSSIDKTNAEDEKDDDDEEEDDEDDDDEEDDDEEEEEEEEEEEDEEEEEEEEVKEEKKEEVKEEEEEIKEEEIKEEEDEDEKEDEEEIKEEEEDEEEIKEEEEDEEEIKDEEEEEDEDEVIKEEEEDEEEFQLIEIQGKEYFTNNEIGGEIYSCIDDDIGIKVGYFDKNGIAYLEN